MLQSAYAIACFLLVYLVTRVCCHIALRPWRASAGQHWTQRARLLFSGRLTAAYCLLTLPVDAYCCAKLINAHDHDLPTPISAWAVSFAAVAAVILARESVSREIRPGSRFGQFFRSTASIVLLRYLSIAAILAATAIMPWHFGIVAWVIAAVTAAALIAMQYGLTVNIMSRLGVLKPADPDLQQLVDDTSRKMGIAVRHTWILPNTAATALALVTTRDIVFTSALLTHLPGEQIAAICAHELGHLSEPPHVRRRRQLSAFLFFPLIFLWPTIALGNRFLLYFAAWLFIVSLLRSQLGGMARQMEIRADQLAGAAVNNPAVLARALERLYEVNQMPAVIGRRRSVHPPLYDRMTAAGIVPDYARPLPPKQRSVLDIALLAILVILITAQFATAGGPWPRKSQDASQYQSR